MFGSIAQAQGDDAPAPLAPEQTLERIEITGSLIKKIETEAALPVSVVTRDDIAKMGVTSVEQLMMILPMFTSANATVAAQSAAATVSGLSAISLRGLGSARTLVLINGRRVAPYGVLDDSASVDVNSLPIAAIERIEILKEGASATYGSDAIAGVVNFILRNTYQGVEATAQYGDSTRGGGATESANLAYGYGDLGRDRYNLMVMAMFERDEQLWGRQRNFAANGLMNALYDNLSSHTFPGNITPNSGPLAGVTMNPGFPNSCAPSSNDPGYVTGGYSRCMFDAAPYVFLVPQVDRASIFSALNVALTRDLTAYAEVSFNHNKISSLMQPSPVSGLITLPPGNPLNNLYPYNQATAACGSPPCTNIFLAPGSLYYPTAYVTGALAANGTPVSASNPLPVLSVRYRTFFNGGRDLNDTTQSPRLVLGIKGTQLGWDVDANILHATNELTETTTGGWWIQSQLLPLLNSGNINLLWPALGPEPSAAQIAQMQATNFNGTIFTNKTGIDDLNLRASRDVGTLPGGPLSVGLGAELRHEKFSSDTNSYVQVGDISGYGGNFLPVSVGRSMYAFFAEVDAPLLPSLETDASVRYDHYQQVGAKLNPKLSFRWQPMVEVLLRGSAGAGFRAPSLTDLYAPQTKNITTVLTDPADCVNNVGSGCNSQPTTTAGGNPNLQPETSRNVSLGIVLQPIKDLSVGADYFNIEVKNLISVGGLSPTFIFSHLSTWGSLVARSATPDSALAGVSGCPCYSAINVSQQNQNVGAQRTSGFDADVYWLLPFSADGGKLSFTLHGTYFAKFQLQNPDGTYTDQIDTANQTLSTNGGVIPRWKHRAEIEWRKNAWDVQLAQNYQGSYQDVGASVVGAWETYDLNLGYSGFKSWSLNLGMRNVLDKDPPYTGNGAYFQSGYDPSYADPRGRFVYLSAGYKFR